jgi:thimet oligopeptidase
MKIQITSLLLLVALAASCAHAAAPELIRSDYTEGEVTKLCEESIAKAQKRLDEIAAIPEKGRNIDNTLLAFENALADFSDESTPLTFMGYVSTNEKVHAEGSKCEEAIGQFNVSIFTRRDLYKAIVGRKAKNKDQARLLFKTVEAFELNGLKLSDAQLAEVKALKSELSTLESKFSSNLNTDTSSVTFTAEELEGVPATALARLKKLEDGKYQVTTKSTDAMAVFENASQSETRRKMMLAYYQRGGAENIKLLQDATVLRTKIAKLLGYKTWAEYRTVNRMAKNQASVSKFLESLKGKLAQRNRADLAKLLQMKKELVPGANSLDQWDLYYLAYQVKKRNFNLDDEKIREYFPADLVAAGLFKIYSEMLSVNYKEVEGAKTWAPDVKLYEIRNKSDDRLIGYFFTDFFPRAGKYGHAAAFPLISGRVLADGSYSHPVSSIVANFTAPADGKPSLMSHDEVETIFHEFGHIMHQTLTRAPYASLSGSGVPQDFVEAPSQMLENWVWSEQVLGMMSGHYLNHEQKLPQDLLKQMLAARDFNQGVFYTRQLLLGFFDFALHTDHAGADPRQLFGQLHKEITSIEMIPGGSFPGSFGHLMGGYDAGYYGYLWSDVYAQDMFSRFPARNLTDSKTGGRYRKVILEQGNMKDPIVLLREFLGRSPKPDAFFKKLGIK